MLASFRVPGAATVLRAGLVALTLNASVDAFSLKEIYPNQVHANLAQTGSSEDPAAMLVQIASQIQSLA